MDITATIDTTDMKNHGWVELNDGWHIVGVDSRDDGQTITSPIVAIDRAAKLAKTKSGSIYHVPGPWPDDLDLPAMRAPVPPFQQTTDAWCPELAAYFAKHCGGTWTDLVHCEDLIPGCLLDASPWSLHVLTGRTQIRHPANRPSAIAEAIRDLPALRAWLLSELDAARAVVGGVA